MSAPDIAQRARRPIAPHALCEYRTPIARYLLCQYRTSRSARVGRQCQHRALRSKRVGHSGADLPGHGATPEEAVTMGHNAHVIHRWGEVPLHSLVQRYSGVSTGLVPAYPRLSTGRAVLIRVATDPRFRLAGYGDTHNNLPPG
eukprot:3441822-Rhodomonas_salina.3